MSHKIEAKIPPLLAAAVAAYNDIEAYEAALLLSGACQTVLRPARDALIIDAHYLRCAVVGAAVSTLPNPSDYKHACNAPERSVSKHITKHIKQIKQLTKTVSRLGKAHKAELQKFKDSSRLYVIACSASLKNFEKEHKELLTSGRIGKMTTQEMLSVKEETDMFRAFLSL